MRLKLSTAVLLSALLLLSACASNLPNVKGLNETQVTGPPVIKSAQGTLPPAQSQAIIGKLEKESGSTDILQHQVKLMENISGRPLFAGNKATLLEGGAEAYAAMLKAIGKAKDSINLETFIFDGDKTGKEFASALLKKRAEGVQVNVIYDSVGSMHTPASFFQRMREGGINVLEYNPVNPFKVRKKWLITHRDHRKILVVDGKVAFTGGVNISGVYRSILNEKDEKKTQNPWRDTHVMIQGPAVAEFQRLFLTTWKWQAGPKLPERDYFPKLGKEGGDYVMVVSNHPGEYNRLTYIMYYTAFGNAQDYIHLTSSYFIPDKETIKALTDAARRGVDVELVLPNESDVPIAFYAGRSYYTRLLKAGVRIFLRKDTVLHAKTAVIDGVWSPVGSTNMDMWSFAKNNEVNAVIIGTDFAGEMEAMFEQDLSHSKEIRPEDWEKRPLFKKIRDSLANLLKWWL